MGFFLLVQRPSGPAGQGLAKRGHRTGLATGHAVNAGRGQAGAGRRTHPAVRRATWAGVAAWRRATARGWAVGSVRSVPY